MSEPAPAPSIAFDRAAGYYDQSRGVPPRVEELVADRVEAAAGPAARLLELGVGTGRIALPLHRRGRQVVGVDLSLPMLERYRAKAAAEGLPPPPLLRADATRLPLRDACVDAVLEVHVLHLIPDWELALAEARRVLVPGGAVLIGRGGGHRGGQGPRMETLNRFDQLAAELGGGPRRVGAEALAAVEGRIYSFTWRLPDQIFHTAAGRLRAELEAAHPDLDTPHQAGHSFTLTAVRF